MPQTKASDSESVVKTTSDDKSIGEGAKEESKGYGLNPVLSSSTNLSTVKEKSFGIRRSELIMAQLKYWWVKALFFFTIFICSYISVLENAIVRVFDGYATESYKKHSLMSTIAILRGVVAAASLPFYARLSDNLSLIHI